MADRNTTHPPESSEPAKLTASASNAMTSQEIEDFLNKKQDARLATIRSDGFPHITPVWYWAEDGKVYFTLGESRMHLRNLRKNPNSTLLMDEDMRLTEGWKGGARAVMLRGTAEIVKDESQLEHYEKKMTDLYLGDEQYDPEFLASMDSEKRYLVVHTPTGKLTWDYTKTA